MKQSTNATKRIKRVFSNANEVLHRWANQTQTDARSKNVFFRGVSVFSYGHHYELGRLVQFNGETVAIINNRGYSVTTGKHISWAFTATEHMYTVATDGDFSSGCIKRGLIREQGEIIDNLFNYFGRLSGWCFSNWGEKSDYSVGGYGAEIRAFNKKTTALGFPGLVIDVTQDYINLYNEKTLWLKQRYETKHAARSEKQKQNEIDREKQRVIDAAKAVETLASWKVGGPFSHTLTSIRPMQLRRVDDTIETTGGASVTLEDARALLKAVETGKIKNGDAVGEYTFEKRIKKSNFDGAKVETDVIQIGCHVIEIGELSRVVGPSLSIVGGSK